ncbi:EAL domain-containing protein [Paraconexibacter sp.]|uniref:bifunctional diguanylate cyclase/phosphodiesterase n=1 Tax=Paraconexibacter sp. TaxID=2949640 RepID=UPI00356AEA8B
MTHPGGDGHPALGHGDRHVALAAVAADLARVGLDPTEVLDVLVQRSADLFGDLCLARMVSDDGGQVQTRAWAHADPDVAQGLEDLVGHRVQPSDEGAISDVLRTREPLILLDASTATCSGALADYRKARGMASVILAPLRSRGRVLGAVHLSRDRGRAPYTPQDCEIFLDLVERAGLTYDNARLYRKLEHRGLVLDQVDAAVVALDGQGRITAWNPAAERYFGYAREEILGRRGYPLISASVPDEQWAAAVREAYAMGWEGEWRMRRADGTTFPAWARVTQTHDDAGDVTGVVAVFTDLTSERQAQQLLERRALQHEAVAKLGERALEGGDPQALKARAVEAAARTLHGHASLLELTEDGSALEVRRAVGFDEDPTGTVVSAEPSGSLAGYALSVGRGVLSDQLHADPRFTVETHLRVDGSGGGMAALVQGRERVHGVLAVVSPHDEHFGEADLRFLQSLANVLADALDRWLAEQEQVRRALHDPLTGLPNRTLVLDRIEQALSRIDRSGEPMAVIFLDIDHFKVINDGLGHGAGDELLTLFAPRLRGAVRPSDTVGRFGGDEFVVVCENVAGEAMARQLAQRVADACAEPFRIAGLEHHVAVSVGVVVCDHACRSADELLRDADAAMYRAKERGRGRVELFDLGMRARAVERVQIERDLRSAIEHGELRLVFQPIVDLRSGRVCRVEALVRWDHPDRGVLQPSQFLHVAEEAGLAVALGQRVLELACGEAATWHRAAVGRPLPVHVNLAEQQLTGIGAHLADTVAQVLATAGIGAEQLVLEITETALLERASAVRAALTPLVDIGVRFYLDDFGTGYSSLGHLSSFPIAGLKIDRSFTAGLGLGGDKTAIVTAILRMAEVLEIDAVAEGVERTDQLLAIRRLGGTLAQGYLLAAPMDAYELRRLLAGGPILEPRVGA